MGFLGLGDKGGADYGGVGKAGENGDVAGERDAEAYGDGELRNGAGAAEECGEIVGERVFRAGYSGAGDEIEEAGRDGGDFGEAFVRGSGRAEKNSVEMMGGENAAIVCGLFGSEIGGEDAVSGDFAGGARECFEAHLQDGIVVAKEHERNLRGLTDAANEIDYTGERGAGFEGAFGGALDGRAVGERIAEGNAELDDVGTRIGEREDKF